jgi:hypothetical protein
MEIIMENTTEWRDKLRHHYELAVTEAEQKAEWYKILLAQLDIDPVEHPELELEFND